MIWGGVPARGRAGLSVPPLDGERLGQTPPHSGNEGSTRDEGKFKKKKKKQTEILRERRRSPRRCAGRSGGRRRGASPGERGGDGAAPPAPKPAGNSSAFAESRFLPWFRSGHAGHTWAGSARAVGGECGAGSSTGALDGKIYFFFFFPLSPLVGENTTPAGGWLLIIISRGSAAALCTGSLTPGLLLSSQRPPGSHPAPWEAEHGRAFRASDGQRITGRNGIIMTLFRGAMLPAMSRKKGQKYLIWLPCGAASF